MEVGDRVDIHYPNGVTEEGRIIDIHQDTVMVRRMNHPEEGAVIVNAKRLRPQGPHRWRLDL